MISVSNLAIIPICVIPSANAATDTLGLVKRRIMITVNGGGINLKKTQIIFWIFRENFCGKNNIKRGGVLIAIPDANKVIIIVEIISLRIGREWNASFNSKIEGKVNDE